MVNNTFDTQIVDLIIEKNKNGSCPENTKDISKCLVDYFNFPASLLKDALALSTKKWMERPLNEKNRLYASQLVTYLIILKEQMQKKLLSTVYKAINDVHSVYYNLNNYEFSQIIQNNKVTKVIDDVIPMLTKSSDQNI
ncbi:hypothetical protein NQ314_021396 [Rhamnusium bicolor]|uniref:Uncharacterized protein n=1 Tax=Rhamnusium bicolor TaxID=1586634 RepID=A0AAV8WJJ2_9CUCU|nr:hypothetical protein NQ314_021396 [Rhamnusium bicolor]